MEKTAVRRVIKVSVSVDAADGSFFDVDGKEEYIGGASALQHVHAMATA